MKTAGTVSRVRISQFLSSAHHYVCSPTLWRMPWQQMSRHEFGRYCHQLQYNVQNSYVSCLYSVMDVSRQSTSVSCPLDMSRSLYYASGSLLVKEYQSGGHVRSLDITADSWLAPVPVNHIAFNLPDSLTCFHSEDHTLPLKKRHALLAPTVTQPVTPLTLIFFKKCIFQTCFRWWRGTSDQPVVTYTWTIQSTLHPEQNNQWFSNIQFNLCW